MVVFECPSITSIISDFQKEEKRELKGRMGAGPLNLLKVTVAIEQGACSNVDKYNNIDNSLFHLYLYDQKQESAIRAQILIFGRQGSFLPTLVQQAPPGTCAQLSAAG